MADDELRSLREENARLKQELADAELRLELFEHSVDGIWDWRIQTGEDFLSPRWKRSLGYEPDELDDTVETWQKLLMPGELERAYAAVTAHWERGEPYEIVLRYRRKDGTAAAMLARGVAVKDEAGEWARMIGTHTDLTAERTRYEKLAAESAHNAATLTALFQELQVGVIVRGANGVIERFNDVAKEVLGLESAGDSPSEWIAHFGLFEEDGVTPFPSEQLPMARALAGEHVDGVTMCVSNAQLDSPRWVDVSARPITREGETVAGVVVFHDITETRNTLNQLRLVNDELAQFAYVASHDLRAPLRGIGTLAEWIEEAAESGDQEILLRHLAQMKGRVLRMGGLLDGLLEYSRVGRDESPVERVELASLVSEICDALAPPESFEIRYEGDVPAITTPLTPLRHVLQNLIQNALTHHDQERGEILITARRTAMGAVITVADDGPGVAEKYRSRAFDMFQTLRRRDEHESTGLGLTIVRKYVESLGGRVWMSDNTPRGLCVSFTWPSRGQS